VHPLIAIGQVLANGPNVVAHRIQGETRQDEGDQLAKNPS
jgi:hypothetical protein